MLDDNKFHGIDIEIMDELARTYNFTPFYNGPFASIGVIYDQRNSTGLMASLWEQKNDIGIGLLSLQYERIKFIPASPFYIFAATSLTIPPTLPITPFQKLFMPYDLVTWCLIIAMYIMGIFIITISRIVSKDVYEFIIGKRVHHPILNMLIALVGGSQNNLPKGTFSRFLLAKCLIFCLVMRGLYQGKLFDVMQKDIHEKEPKTIDDLVDKNFTFYAYDTLARRIQDPKIVKRLKSISLGQLEEYRHKTLDPTFNGVIMSYEAQVAYFNYLNHKKYVYIICKERFVTNQMVFYFQRNHFIADKMSEKIEWLREFGITNYIIGRYVDLKFLISPVLQSSPEALNFHDLSGIFMIWTLGLLLAFLIWLFEVFYNLLIIKQKYKCFWW